MLAVYLTAQRKRQILCLTVGLELYYCACIIWTVCGSVCVCVWLLALPCYACCISEWCDCRSRFTFGSCFAVLSSVCCNGILTDCGHFLLLSISHIICNHSLLTSKGRRLDNVYTSFGLQMFLPCSSTLMFRFEVSNPSIQIDIHCAKFVTL
jgi:hypothetical protein